MVVVVVVGEGLGGAGGPAGPSHDPCHLKAQRSRRILWECIGLAGVQ